MAEVEDDDNNEALNVKETWNKNNFHATEDDAQNQLVSSFVNLAFAVCCCCCYYCSWNCASFRVHVCAVLLQLMLFVCNENRKKKNVEKQNPPIEAVGRVGRDKLACTEEQCLTIVEKNTN